MFNGSEDVDMQRKWFIVSLTNKYSYFYGIACLVKTSFILYPVLLRPHQARKRKLKVPHPPRSTTLSTSKHYLLVFHLRLSHV
ncbi:hypothetical protein SERLA73DRAFT_171037 [Serpula lacrymans var. lacrymans S7.3]|uniref:Uncharacterized protein n=1 Tax=Serpula lacrymans var. lacrymans (strain S7.3) TaxID=936435 RepID=F8Q9F0_SERL3|nr:hypothetical protein SERLA73DRAFT_171037 [Serpula lacrymans var. lacrymans S7.3]